MEGKGPFAFAHLHHHVKDGIDELVEHEHAQQFRIEIHRVIRFDQYAHCVSKVGHRS